MCNTSGWDGKYIHSLLDFLEWVPSLEKVHLHQFLLYLKLRSILSNGFNNITWQSKIEYLCLMLIDLETLHGLGYCHKDFHSGNILQADTICISDFGLSGPANEQKSNGKVYGVMPYIAPEVLYGGTYTLSSDINCVALAIYNGLRPEFGKGSNEDNKEEYGYKGNEIKAAFEEADKEIPNISTSYENNTDAVYTSRAFSFNNLLSKSVNSSIITSYINNEGIGIDSHY
ncbi:hypothetical protein GLOIN_2v1787411 [Rhizophagus irregularis DAOM 181602=DAOM 197198]|uniref:Protein kinase domain-containing protein n=1 Tax=Rhizophagus irregularis (strain DAOM 181602 / DAOM 197198 / MUCL 43194) TaxID=747089 RepID=A0A2P4P5Y3_RHIID|nr:hypothetical protein GLOIN_2v1787411 [Rhizophagus irregularis DAOM 181602=DAOM 197198]POG60796.1 hypothetical protein GLOIN_2v1787411 [Rhizophagus irregularis DAOM 181602=DAOM 197198]|eukprot:XP_025167662.1 hypothetical protein GLOIN_2v1787411 [Rhizophagus irregularis DAOM 181602=DAOM 197198]